MPVFPLFYSPTYTTERVTLKVAQQLAAGLDMPVTPLNITLPDGRETQRAFGPDDVVVLGYPVYGGRIPVYIEDYIHSLRGRQTKAVLLAVYGNRAFEDALIEGADILGEHGFQVMAAGAFIGEHSFTRKLAGGRPDNEDLTIAAEFGKQIAEKIKAGNMTAPDLPGNRPYKERKPPMVIKPFTTSDCFDCMVCAEGCPVGIISHSDPRVVGEGCTRCHACVKHCPVNAKYFRNTELDKLKTWLIENFTSRKEIELFL